MKPELSIAGFFDALNRDYTAVIERCFPRYREMLETLLEYLPATTAQPRVLELGCGTGNLSVLLRNWLPQAHLTLVDLSHESLETCRARIGNGRQTHYLAKNMATLEFPSGSFDLIVSSIAIHHLTSEQKRELLHQCYQWLTPNGTLLFADQFRGATLAIYEQHLAGWQQMSLKAGGTEDEFSMWMQHQREHDHHDSLTQHFAWLEQAGFKAIDCVWRCRLWAIVHARKQV